MTSIYCKYQTFFCLATFTYLLSWASGAGQINSNGASGASHGSRGGRGQSYIEAVDAYGTIYVESTWGSGGGSYVNNGKNGGRGGGYAHLNIRGSVTISGQILANAKNAVVSFLMFCIHRNFCEKLFLSVKFGSGVLLIQITFFCFRPFSVVLISKEISHEMLIIYCSRKLKKILRVHTVKFQKIWTPEKFAVIILEFEQHGFTIAKCVQMM